MPCELPWRRSQVDEATFLHHSMGLIAQTTDSQARSCTWSSTDGMTLQLAAGIRRAGGQPDRHAHRSGSRTVGRCPPCASPSSSTTTPAAGRPPDPGNIAVHRLAYLPVIDHGGVQLLVGTANKADPYTLQDIETIQLMAKRSLARRMAADGRRCAISSPSFVTYC